MKTSFRKRRGRGVKQYNPSHEELSRATQEFLNKGGKITQLISREDAPTFLSDRMAVDEFLLGT